MAVVDLGFVYEACPEELAELREALAEITHDVPADERVAPLAGPNDVVQILIDAATWTNALYGWALVLGGKFAASFGSELGKLAAGEVWKEKKNYYDALKNVADGPFLRLVRTIRALREKDQTITIAVRVLEAQRNAGLVISSDDPAEIAWQIANVTRCAQEIKDVIVAAATANSALGQMQGSNPDMSVVVEVLPSGDVRVLGVVITK